MNTWDGKDRRMNDEQLGYIKGKVEGMEKDIKEIKDAFSTHVQQEAETRKELMKEIKGVREELNVYRHVWWTLKAVALTVIAGLTLKLGDIATFFRGIK